MQVVDLMTELKTAQETAEGINNEERMFGWGATKYEHIDKMVTKLEPYCTLWMTTFEFFDKSNKWMNQPFKDVVAEEVDEMVGGMFRKLFQLTKVFSGVSSGQGEQEAPMKVAVEVCDFRPVHTLAFTSLAFACPRSAATNIVQGLNASVHVQCKEKIAAFQQYIPLMQAVCNQGMRDRHWNVVAEETGIEVSGESTASLKYLLDNDIMDFLPRIVEISDTASREWSIEKALGKMLTDWMELEFEVAPWKETGVCLHPRVDPRSSPEIEGPGVRMCVLPHVGAFVFVNLMV